MALDDMKTRNITNERNGRLGVTEKINGGGFPGATFLQLKQRSDH